MPAMMRYQPQGLNPYFLMMPMKNFIATKATKNATTMPTKNIGKFCGVANIISMPVKPCPCAPHSFTNKE